jgi:acid phosphatase
MEPISRRLFLSATASFAVAPRNFANAATFDLTFLVIGDWGKGSADQRMVAVQMAESAKAIGAQFVISTGDNFYPDGVKSVDAKRWVNFFEDIYDAPPLMIPWYITLGNHDHKGNISAQIEYTKLSSRWRLPANYYKHTQLISGAESADFFHLDTTSIHERYPSEDPQLAWLERELAASTAAWKIVVGHHPVYAGGRHTYKEKLVSLLKPLFARYGVQVYLNGHDHHMEHVIVDGTHYLTSGAASDPERAKAVEGTRFVVSERLGFMIARLRPSVMQIEFIDVEGTSLYLAEIRRSGLYRWGPFSHEGEIREQGAY